LLDRHAPSAGLTEPAHRLLREGTTWRRAVDILLDTWLPDVDRTNLLRTLGLGAVASAEGLPPITDTEAASTAVARREVRSYAPIRDTALVTRLKTLLDDTCQVCGIRLETRAGGRSDGAHIRGLGFPHDGPDVWGNLLCLCPNHHALFDGLTLYIDEDWRVHVIQGGHDRETGPLRRHPDHAIDPAHVAYHRDLCRNPPVG